MSRFTALTIGLLTVISIAPSSQAMTTNASLQSLKQPTGDLHAQLIIKIGGEPDRGYRRDDRHRDFEQQREAERRRREYYSQRRHARERFRRDLDEHRRDERRGEHREQREHGEHGEYPRDR
jgi:hypothetical protein